MWLAITAQWRSWTISAINVMTYWKSYGKLPVRMEQSLFHALNSWQSPLLKFIEKGLHLPRMA
jgi:hypothetical protein